MSSQKTSCRMSSVKLPSTTWLRIYLRRRDSSFSMAMAMSWFWSAMVWFVPSILIVCRCRRRRGENIVENPISRTRTGPLPAAVPDQRPFGRMKSKDSTIMIRKTRLFTPGPTPLLPAAQFAMAAADIHHRTPEFIALNKKVLAQLKEFVGTKNDVLLMAASGTGAMEAAVSNLTSPGDRVLVLSAGKFGERWVSLAKAFGCEVDLISAPYGKTFDLEEVRHALTPHTRAVYMQATETSTAIRHCVPGVADLLKSAGSDALLVVDGITGLGTTHLDVDAWGVDVIIGGSQKAVMIPPGLAYLGVSERAFTRMASTKNPRYYFDLLKERKNALKGDSSYTPSVALIAGLGAALDYIAAQGGGDLAEGRKKLIENAETCAAMTRAGV